MLPLFQNTTSAAKRTRNAAGIPINLRSRGGSGRATQTKPIGISTVAAVNTIRSAVLEAVRSPIVERHGSAVRHTAADQNAWSDGRTRESTFDLSYSTRR